MGEQSQGSSKAGRGPLSLAVSMAFNAIIETGRDRGCGYSRDWFADVTGFAKSRIKPLLEGERAWYLQDVETACSVFEFNLEAFLHCLDVRQPSNVIPALAMWQEIQDSKVAPVLQLPVSPPADDDPLPVAAHDKPKRKPRKGIEAEHDGA